jgi:exoribonuclease-2
VHLSITRDAAGASELSVTEIAEEPAADMVREMMLLAGEAAARFAFKNKIPFQYVSQETPDIPKELPEGLAGEYRKRRSMKSRKVGTVPADHAGLGLGMYSQVTSPLRRYGDLVSHQQLRLFIDGKPLMDTDDMLTRIAQGDSAARECTFAERESNLHWILVYLSAHPDWTAEAVVVEKTGALSTILIPSLAQEAKINLKDDLGLNAKIRVRAGNINIPAQSITYIPAGE